MKQLLNTLFVTSEDIYLSLEGENVLANRDKTVVARYPLHTLQAIVSFSYAGASPALMGKCAEAGIGLAFCSPHGRFLARTCGESSGNVLLRREQYRIADDPARSCEIARTMIFGKLSNGAASIQRTLRDHVPRVADCGLEKAAATLRAMLPQVLAAADLDSLRGIEGAAATAYFDVLDHMLLSRKEAFFFHGRSRRPPEIPEDLAGAEAGHADPPLSGGKAELGYDPLCAGATAGSLPPGRHCRPPRGGAWIEISWPVSFRSCMFVAPPRGGRGLKC